MEDGGSRATAHKSDSAKSDSAKSDRAKSDHAKERQPQREMSHSVQSCAPDDVAAREVILALRVQAAVVDVVVVALCQHLHLVAAFPVRGGNRVGRAVSQGSDGAVVR